MYSGGIQQTGPYKPNLISPLWAHSGKDCPIDIYAVLAEGWGVGGDIGPATVVICLERDFIPEKQDGCTQPQHMRCIHELALQWHPYSNRLKLYGWASALKLMYFSVQHLRGLVSVHGGKYVKLVWPPFSGSEALNLFFWFVPPRCPLNDRGASWEMKEQDMINGCIL